MNLVILHYHLRPGGIRRVIELAAPHIVRALDGHITEVTVATGEAPDRKWRALFLDALRRVPVRFVVTPSFGYVSEQHRRPEAIRTAIRRVLNALFDGKSSGNCVVWAHNLGLARNLLLTQELVVACESRGITLLAHHHDWWFDNRWQRWPELQRTGFHTLSRTAEVVFGHAHTQHLCINQSDWNVLKKHFRARAAWLPNLADRAPSAPSIRVRRAHRWLQARLGHDNAPVWILPCRLLRRKNVAEALLLKRWLRPAAWLVTTGGVSSAEEQPYLEKISAAAHAHHWRIRLGVLAGDESRKPSVSDLLAASEVVLLTSVQEGFGLPYIEAAAAGRPLIARNLPNIAPDLKQFGFTLPQSYDEIFVHPSLFDWRSEHQRQKEFYSQWLKQLPFHVRQWARKPALLAAGNPDKPVPFSRLTLTAQIQVLLQPPSRSWQVCAPLNPFLLEWRRRAERADLRVTPWPRKAGRWLSGKAYALRFREALNSDTGPAITPGAASAVQKDFIHAKLAARYLYPLLWRTDT